MSELSPISRRPGARRQIVASIVLGVLVAVAGVGVLPAPRGSVGPAEISLGLAAGTEGTTLGLPPFGNVRADTHRVPFDVKVDLVEVEVEPLARSVTSQRGRDLLGRVVATDLRTLAIRASIQLALMLVALAAAIAALLLGRHLVPILLTSVTAFAVLAIGLVSIMVTFDVSAFEEPRYSGSLTRAREVVNAVTESGEILDEARSRFDIASERLSDLISLLAVADANPLEAETIVLHVSDIHANPIGFAIVKQLARRFDVDAVIDTGDLAASFLDTGGISRVIDPVDRMVGREVAEVGVPYLYVPGNHDSPELRRVMAEVRNVSYLGGTPATIGALEVMGWPDPTFARTPIPESEKSEQRRSQADDVAARVNEEDPDILAVHDVVLASESFGAVPLVLAGHVHESSETVEEGTRVLTVGSTGATGLKSLTVEADLRYEAQVLYFDAEGLIAVDHLALEDLGGDFELTRTTYEREPAGV